MRKAALREGLFLGRGCQKWQPLLLSVIFPFVKLWLSKNSEIPVRDQLVAQITLGAASGDLPPGKRLPSTRELARRFQIHQNTVSSAYRELATKGVVEFRKGSGVFVAKGKPHTDGSGLDRLVRRFLEQASADGFSADEIRTEVQKALDAKPLDGFLVIESDDALRDILIQEICSATDADAIGITLERFSQEPFADGRQFVAMFDEEEKLKPLLPAGASCTFLRANSVPSSMSGETRPQADDLIAIVSGWGKFISFAKLFLLAAKVDSGALITRQTSEQNWKKGLDHAAMIICDSLTARDFPGDKRVRVFQLIAETSIEQLRNARSSI